MGTVAQDSLFSWDRAMHLTPVEGKRTPQFPAWEPFERFLAHGASKGFGKPLKRLKSSGQSSSPR